MRPVAHSNMPISAVKFFMKKGAVNSCCRMLALIIFLFLYSKYVNRKGIAKMWNVASSLRALLKTILKSCAYRAITIAVINENFRATAILCWFCIEDKLAIL